MFSGFTHMPNGELLPVQQNIMQGQGSTPILVSSTQMLLVRISFQLLHKILTVFKSHVYDLSWDTNASIPIFQCTTACYPICHSTATCVPAICCSAVTTAADDYAATQCAAISDSTSA